MQMCGYIYWRPEMDKKRDGRFFADVHLLVGYNEGTVTDFQKMATVLRKTFPAAKNYEIKCGRVFESDAFNRFSIITWSGPIKKHNYPGWHQHQDAKSIEYSWR